MANERLHHAYLMRLWVVHHNSERLWRASLEDVHTGERRAFADLVSLCCFLQEVTAALATSSCDELDRFTDQTPPL